MDIAKVIYELHCIVNLSMFIDHRYSSPSHCFVDILMSISETFLYEEAKERLYLLQCEVGGNLLDTNSRAGILRLRSQRSPTLAAVATLLN